jgi:hypothetical protein
VVTALARDEHGGVARGRLALALTNPGYLSGRSGRRVLPVEVDRFAPRGSLRVRNIHSEPVTLSSALLRGLACRDGRPLEARAVAAADLLGETPRLAGGQIWSGKVAVGDELFAEPACVADVTLRGTNARGQDVTARFALELGVSTARARPITDAATAARVRRAQALLGRPQVTPDDLDRLAREGRL